MNKQCQHRIPTDPTMRCGASVVYTVDVLTVLHSGATATISSLACDAHKEAVQTDLNAAADLVSATYIDAQDTQPVQTEKPKRKAKAPQWLKARTHASSGITHAIDATATDGKARCGRSMLHVTDVPFDPSKRTVSNCGQCKRFLAVDQHSAK